MPPPPIKLKPVALISGMDLGKQRGFWIFVSSWNRVTPDNTRPVGVLGVHLAGEGSRGKPKLTYYTVFFCTFSYAEETFHPDDVGGPWGIILTVLRDMVDNENSTSSKLIIRQLEQLF